MNETIQTKINKMISQWTKTYRFNTKPFTNQDKENLDGYSVFKTVLSESDAPKPIPEVSVSILFYIPNDPKEFNKLRYRFENEALYRSITDSFNLEQFDSYVEKLMENKSDLREEYFLANDFERTRVLDYHIYDLDEKKVIYHAPEESISINRPDLVENRDRLKMRDSDEIKIANLKLFDTTLETINQAIDPLTAGFVQKQDIINLMYYLGIPVTLDEFNTTILPKEKENSIISLENLHFFINELLISKFVFYQSTRGYSNLLQKMNQSADIMFKNKYKIVLDRFIAFLTPMAKKGTLNHQTIIINLEKMKNSLFSEDQYVLILDSLSSIEKYNLDNLELINKAILNSKKNKYVENAMILQRSPLDSFLLENFGNDKISKETFFKFFNENKIIRLTKRQTLIIWSFMKDSGLVEEEGFDINRYVSILSFYLLKIVYLKDMFIHEKDTLKYCGEFCFLNYYDKESFEIFKKQFSKDVDYLKINKETMVFCFEQMKHVKNKESLLKIDQLKLLNKAIKEWLQSFVLL